MFKKIENMQKISWLIIWIYFITLLLSCSSQPKQAVLPLEVRLEAARQILSDNIKLISVVEICSLYGEEIKKKSLGIQSQWHQENWSFVQLGFAEYQTYFHKRIMEVGEVQAYLDPFYLILRAQEEKGKPISHVVETYTRKDQICDDLLFEYRVGQKDIKKNARHFAIITSLEAQHAQRHLLSPRKLPEFSDMVKPSRHAGTSRYAIEKQVKGAFCPQVEIVNLINRCPDVSYGIYCPSQDAKALSCQWGQCTWLEPRATLQKFLHEDSERQ